MVRQGKTLYVGISDARPNGWRRRTRSASRGWSPLLRLQIEYSLVERMVERELIPTGKALNIGVTAWASHSNGMLTGKYHGHGPSESANAGRMNLPCQETLFPHVSALKQLLRLHHSCF